MKSCQVVQTYRKEWVDILRAIAMLLVIYGHLLSGYEHTNFYVITSPVKIPLFFAITGYVFNPKNGDIKVFFSNIFHKLIIPLFFYTMVLMPIKLFAAYKGFVNHTVKEVFISFLTGNELWYLPCCIFAEILFFFTLKYLKKEIHVIFVSVILATIGFVIGNYKILSVANFNTAFSAQLFILIGYVYIKHERWFVEKRQVVILIGLSIYIALCIISQFFFPKLNIDVHLNQYYSFPINIISIITGNITLFAFVSHFINQSSMLSFIGQNTIVYYVTHEYVIGFIGLLYRIFHIHRNGTFFEALVFLIIVCVVCAVLSVFINKYLPFSVGKKAINQKFNR